MGGGGGGGGGGGTLFPHLYGSGPQFLIGHCVIEGQMICNLRRFVVTPDISLFR